MVFNASKACVRQLDKGEHYHLLQPVYALAILNDNFDTKTEEFYHHYRIVNYRNTEEIIKGLEFVMVELPKFKPEKMSDRKMASLWLRFLNEVSEDPSKIPDDLKENTCIGRAIDMCEEGAFTEAELFAYEKYWDIIRTESGLIAESKAEGIVEGEARGIAKGRAEGISQRPGKKPNRCCSQLCPQRHFRRADTGDHRPCCGKNPGNPPFGR
jgi:predicted transposase/invertase (TIGR01784 family)